VPGVGLVVALIVITLIGALAANLVGRTVLHYWEYFLGRMPVVRSVYSAVKQIFQTAFAKPGSNFQNVGLIEFPRKGAHVVVFVARQLDSGEIGLEPGDAMYSVFMPTTPNPTSGFLFFLHKEEVIILDLTVEEAAKLVISAGLVSPERLRENANVPILDEDLTARLTEQAKEGPDQTRRPRKQAAASRARRRASGLPGGKEPDGLVALEEIEQQPQRLAARAREVRVAGEDQLGVVARRGDEVAVGGDVGEAERRHAGLAGAEQFARAAQAQGLPPRSRSRRRSRAAPPAASLPSRPSWPW
jgi:uncharacterized membrane protein